MVDELPGEAICEVRRATPSCKTATQHPNLERPVILPCPGMIMSGRIKARQGDQKWATECYEKQGYITHPSRICFMMESWSHRRYVDKTSSAQYYATTCNLGRPDLAPTFQWLLESSEDPQYVAYWP
jgi:hypothetical protein